MFSVTSTSIVPFVDHVPAGHPDDTRASTCGGPPSMEMRPSPALLKNPMVRLSGDQNGSRTPSISARRRGAASSSARSQSPSAA
jgi:hypothetical protein